LAPRAGKTECSEPTIVHSPLAIGEDFRIFNLSTNLAIIRMSHALSAHGRNRLAKHPTIFLDWRPRKSWLENEHFAARPAQKEYFRVAIILARRMHWVIHTDRPAFFQIAAMKCCWWTLP
jgi:hypothetical protein